MLTAFERAAWGQGRGPLVNLSPLRVFGAGVGQLLSSLPVLLLSEALLPWHNRFN